MKGKRALAVFVAALVSQASTAADWSRFAEMPPAGSYGEIDITSIAPAPYNRKKAWFRWNYSKPQHIGEWIAKADPQITAYSSSVTLVYFDCAQRTQATIQSIMYSPDGNVVASYTLSQGQAAWSEFAPDTIGEMMHALVCKPPN